MLVGNVPKVSVFMMTYNHAQYIKQALDSVLAQETTFVVEIVVGEDKSTDGTREIVVDYAQRYPTRIRALLHETNIGASRNQMLVLNACRGEYIAILEGDDYWISNNKLQKQVDFLESNLDYAICTHNLLYIGDNGDSLNKFVRPEKNERTYELNDLAEANLLATASCVYRNNFTAGPSPTNYPDWLLNVRIGDYCLHMLAARHGKIKYFPDIMGAYRTHSGGVWTKESHVGRAIMLFNTFHHLRKEFSGEVRNKILGQQEANFQILSDADDITLNAFLQQNKEEVMDFLAEDYPRIIQRYFHNSNAVRSAEYRLGKTLVKPVRKLIDWYRSSN